MDQPVNTRSRAGGFSSPKTSIISPFEMMTKLKPNRKGSNISRRCLSEKLTSEHWRPAREKIEQVTSCTVFPYSFGLMYCRCCRQKHDSLCELRTKISLQLHSAVGINKIITIQSSRRRFSQSSIPWCWSRGTNHKIAERPPHHSAQSRPDNTGNWRNENRVRVSFYHERSFWTPKMREFLLH